MVGTFVGEPKPPNVSFEQRASRELINLIWKLRWIGEGGGSEGADAASKNTGKNATISGPVCLQRARNVERYGLARQFDRKGLPAGSPPPGSG